MADVAAAVAEDDADVAAVVVEEVSEVVPMAVDPVASQEEEKEEIWGNQILNAEFNQIKQNYHI